MTLSRVLQRITVPAACLPAHQPTATPLQITFTLEEGLSWEDFPVISLWCEDFTADFGHVEIKSGEHSRQAVPCSLCASPCLLPACAALAGQQLDKQKLFNCRDDPCTLPRCPGPQLSLCSSRQQKRRLHRLRQQQRRPHLPHQQRRPLQPRRRLLPRPKPSRARVGWAWPTAWS